ncbi:MAG: glycosyltransferase [Propionivibrio sp.]|nr:glycosyltransferase [Propionivibrio sp.]
MSEEPAKIRSMPLVSVVVPTYNHAQFIGHALASVCAQTFTNWEAIVVNNFSTDDTESIVASMVDPRISLVSFANNGVIAASRNHGVGLARGEFVAFLDSDDCWYPRKLERCLKMMTLGYDLVCHGELWVSERIGGRRKREVLYGPEARASFDALLFDGNCISTSAVVVRRRLLEAVCGFDESNALITAEDYHLWLKLARAGAKIGFVREVLGEFRIHDGNNSKSALRNMRAVRVAFERTYAEMAERSCATRIKAVRRRAIIDYSGGRGLQDNGEHRQAWVWFLKAIMHWPFIPKFYAALFLNALHRRVR